MRKNLLQAICFCLISWALGITQAAQAQTVYPDYQDGQLYLKLQDTTTLNLDPYAHNVPVLNLILTTFGVDSLYRPFRSGHPALQNIYRLEFTSILGVDNLILQLQALSFVDYAEKIPLMRPVGTDLVLPNDMQGTQWGLTKIQAELAWGITLGNSAVTVAIVDNAERVTHEDLSPVIYSNPNETPNNFLDDDLNGYADDVHGYDVADMDGNVNPPILGTGWEHGSHTSGIAGAATNNGIGIASIGYGISIMPVKAANDAAGGNSLSRAYEGVDYARSAGADVISMSWGSLGSSLTGDLILSIANNNGILLVAAAGNNGDSVPFYPAANPVCLAVGSTDQADLRSAFSNYGSYVDVMAPGSDIYSCFAGNDSDYGTLSGTSMACPLVAGLAGLIMSSNSSITASQARQMIIDGCVNIDALNPGYAGKLGAGRINAYQSLLTTSLLPSAQADAQVRLFPNPAQGQVRMQLPNGWERELVSVTAYDMSGRQVLDTQVAYDQAIDCQFWNTGLYLVRILQGNKSKSTLLQVD